jgi:predicted Zn-dependent protease
MKSERFQKLVDANPNNELFRFSLGQALMDEGQERDAIQAFDVCLKDKPDWMVASILRGKCLLSLGQKDEAKAELQRSLRLAIAQHHEAPEAEVRKLLEGL